MKRIRAFVILILIVGKAFSTNQVKDILIYNNDTLFLYDSPLDQIQDISKRINDLNHYPTVESTDCWRGFYAEWRLINNELFLSKISRCNTDSCLNQVIQKVLGKKFINGLLKADWVVALPKNTTV